MATSRSERDAGRVARLVGVTPSRRQLALALALAGSWPPLGCQHGTASGARPSVERLGPRATEQAYAELLAAAFALERPGPDWAELARRVERAARWLGPAERTALWARFEARRRQAAAAARGAEPGDRGGKAAAVDPAADAPTDPDAWGEATPAWLDRVWPDALPYL